MEKILYYLRAGAATRLDIDWSALPAADRPEEMEIKVIGAGGIDTVYVASGAQVNFTQTGTGADLIVLSGAFGEYTQDVDRATGVYQFTRMVGPQQEKVTVAASVDHDRIVFADGAVDLKYNHVQPQGTPLRAGTDGFRDILAQDLAPLASLPPPPALEDETLAGVPTRVMIKDNTGVTVPMPASAQALVITGGGGADKVYVTAGSQVDFTMSGTGNDTIYVQGRFGDYSQDVDAATGAYTFTRQVGTETEVVKVMASVDRDRIVFADGAVNLKYNLPQGGGVSLRSGGVFRAVQAADLDPGVVSAPATSSGFAGVRDGRADTGPVLQAGDTLDIEAVFEDRIFLAAGKTLTLQASVDSPAGPQVLSLTAIGDAATAAGVTILHFATVLPAYLDDSDGVVVLGNSLRLGTATLNDFVDRLGQPVPVSFGDAAIASARVGAPPSVLLAGLQGIDSATGAAKEAVRGGDYIVVTLEMTSPVVVHGVPEIELEIGGALRRAMYVSGGGRSTLTFRYQVGFDVEDGAGGVEVRQLILDGASIRNAAGFDMASEPLSAPNTLAVDNTVPDMPHMALHADTGVAGDGVTSDPHVVLTGIEPGTRWEYSLNGVDWVLGEAVAATGSGTFALPPGVYPQGSILVSVSDKAGNRQVAAMGDGYTIDTQAPAVTGKTGGQIDAGANLTLIFDEDVLLGTGSLRIVRAGTDEVVEEIAGADLAARVAIAGKQVTIDPLLDLRPGASYYVLASEGLFTDAAGHPAAAITDKDGWTFTTTPLPPRNINVALSGLVAGTASNGFVIYGENADDQSGTSISSAGDINGDGYDDLIVGTPWYDAADAELPWSNSGRTYVVYGGPAGGAVQLSDIAAGGSQGFVIRNSVVGEMAGWAVSGAGDVNGDGLVDLIVSAPDARLPMALQVGYTYVLYGRTGNAPIDLSNVSASGTTDGFVIRGSLHGEQSGMSLSGAGDVNGDGLADIIVGAPSNNASGSKSGRAYVVYGKSGNAPVDLSMLSATAGAMGFEIGGIPEYNDNNKLGYSVSGAGDINGDGYDDVVVGVVNGDVNAVDAGRSYVVFGGPARSGGPDLAAIAAGASTAGFVINGQAASDHTGWSVSSAGDVNGDGLADLIIGARDASPAGRQFAGRAYVVFGKTDGAVVDLAALSNPANTLGFAIDGALARDRAGMAVSAAGDINGDGLADVLVGSSEASAGGPYARGVTHVVYGKADGAPVDLLGLQSGASSAGFLIIGAGQFNRSGIAVSAAGDVNGDGYADLFIGAPQASFDEVQAAGMNFVVYGGPGLLNQDVTLVETRAGQAIGSAASETLFGSAGNDLLAGNGGRDVFYAGAGNDTIVLDNGNVARLGEAGAMVDGGSGIDTLKLANGGGAGIVLDLTALGNTRLQGIERFDITGTADNTLKLSLGDVLQLQHGEGASAMRVFDHWGAAADADRRQIVIDGDAGDRIVLTDMGDWILRADTLDDPENAGHAYLVYEHKTAGVQLIVEDGIAVL